MPMQLRHSAVRCQNLDAAQAAHHHIEIVPVYKIRQQPLALVHADIRKVVPCESYPCVPQM